MTEFTPVDMTEVTHSAGSFIDDPGIYDVVIVKADNTASKAGTPGWRFTYRDVEGRTIQDTMWLSEAAKWRLENLIDAAGHLTDAEKKKFIPPMIYNKTVKIVVAKSKENPAYLNIESILPSNAVIDTDALPPLPLPESKNGDLPF